MRKKIAGLVIMFALALTASSMIANEADPGLYSLLGLTALAPLNPSSLANLDLMALPAAAAKSKSFGSADSIFNARSADPEFELSLGETALAPLNPSPLADLDLLPLPVPASEARSAGFAALDLNPRSVVANYSPVSLGRGIDFRAVGDRLFDVSIYSLIALNIADYFSTRKALTYPGLQEGNPLMKSIVKSPVAFAALKIGISAVSYWSLKSLYKKNKALGWVVSTVSNFAMSYVVSNNIRLINMIKGR